MSTHLPEAPLETGRGRETGQGVQDQEARPEVTGRGDPEEGVRMGVTRSGWGSSQPGGGDPQPPLGGFVSVAPTMPGDASGPEPPPQRLCSTRLVAWGDCG